MVGRRSELVTRLAIMLVRIGWVPAYVDGAVPGSAYCGLSLYRSACGTLGPRTISGTACRPDDAGRAVLLLVTITIVEPLVDGFLLMVCRMRLTWRSAPASAWR